MPSGRGFPGKQYLAMIAWLALLAAVLAAVQAIDAMISKIHYTTFGKIVVIGLPALTSLTLIGMAVGGFVKSATSRARPDNDGRGTGDGDDEEGYVPLPPEDDDSRPRLAWTRRVRRPSEEFLGILPELYRGQ